MRNRKFFEKLRDYCNYEMNEIIARLYRNQQVISMLDEKCKQYSSDSNLPELIPNLAHDLSGRIFNKHLTDSDKLFLLRFADRYFPSLTGNHVTVYYIEQFLIYMVMERKNQISIVNPLMGDIINRGD